jgi:hypothetical protein
MSSIILSGGRLLPLTARQRSQLSAPLSPDADQPLDGSVLTAALAEEIKQQVGVQVFNDPLRPEQERAGLIRDHVPQLEDFFSRVRRCKINGLRTANFFPPLNVGDFLQICLLLGLS